MKELTKENRKGFNELYYNFHDSYMYNISYDISKSQIELLFDIQWKCEPILKYDTNKVKLKMLFLMLRSVLLKKSNILVLVVSYIMIL